MVSVVVLVVVVGSMLTGMVLLQKTREKELKQVWEREYREYMARWLKTGVDCAKTTTITCSGSGTYVSLPRKGPAGAPALIVPPSGTTFTVVGQYQLRVSCTGTGPRNFAVEMRRIGDSTWMPMMGIDPIVCT